jgi:hypothetical protein
VNFLSRPLKFLLLLIGLAGCSTSTLNVKTTPESAEVFVVTRDGATLKMGKTPLEVSTQNYGALFSEATTVKVQKDGYTPQSVLVPPLNFGGGRGNLQFNLEESTLPKVCTAQVDLMNELAQGVAEVTNQIQSKRYFEAQAQLQNMFIKFDTVSVLYDLQGNVFYLQRDLDRALASYKKSNLLSPNNSQTLRMIRKIQQVSGTPQGVDQ